MRLKRGVGRWVGGLIYLESMGYGRRLYIVD